MIYRTSQGMIFIYKEKNYTKIWAACVLGGIIAGTLILNLMMGYKGQVLVKQVEQYHRLFENQLEPTSGLFFRICFYRIGLVIIVTAMVRLLGNYYVFYPMLFLGGIAFGYTLALLSFCFGIKGIFCMLAYMFPHYLVYIPLILGVLRETSSQMHRVFSWKFRRFSAILVIVLLGCAAESAINPMFLKFFLKTFL